MLYTPTPLEGAFVIDVQRRSDERGFFARSFCVKEFEQQGLNPAAAQMNVCFNGTLGTVRGMHYQVAPAVETKVVRCTRGSVWDVIVDLRPGSPTYLQHFGVELTADNYRALYVPAMFAHGYQTLTPEAEIVYIVSEFYAPDCERGLRFDDPTLKIEWPLPVNLVSEKDRSWELLG